MPPGCDRLGGRSCGQHVGDWSLATAEVARDGGIRRSGHLAARRTSTGGCCGCSWTARVWFLALYAASLLRLDFDPGRLDGFHIALLLPVAWAGQAALGWYYGLYRGRWINGSFDEVAALGRTVFAHHRDPPRRRPALARRCGPRPVSSVIGAGLLAFLAMGGARYAARQMLENRRRQEARRPPQAGDHLRRRRGWRPHDPGDALGRRRARTCPSRSSTTTRASAT